MNTDAADRWPANASLATTLLRLSSNKSASDRRKLHAGRATPRRTRALVLARDAAQPRADSRRRHRLPAAAHDCAPRRRAARRVARAAVRDAAAVPLLGDAAIFRRFALVGAAGGGTPWHVDAYNTSAWKRAGGWREAVGAVPARRRAARRAARRRLPHAVRARRAARVVWPRRCRFDARRASAPLHAARRRDPDDASGVVAHRAQPVAALCALAQFRARRAVGAGAGRRRGRRAAAGARRAAPRCARGGEVELLAAAAAARRPSGALPGRSARRVAAAAAAAAAGAVGGAAAVEVRRRARRAPRW